MADILRILQESDRPLSTNRIADRAEVDWHTAKKRLDTLVREDQVHRSAISNRLTLYWDQEIPF